MYFLLLEYTAQRPGDVLAMRWDNYSPNVKWEDYTGPGIEIVQQKTKKRVRIPVHRNLADALVEARTDNVVRIHGNIVVRPDGREYPTRRMSDLFRKVSTDVGSESLQPRDLRRTACVRLAEAGCNDIRISAISGHSIEGTRQILETYVVRTETMAVAAIKLWEQNEPKKSLTRGRYVRLLGI